MAFSQICDTAKVRPHRIATLEHSEIPYNHYSFLKTLEYIYETKDYLGYAAQPGLQGFFGCVNSDIKTKTGDQFGSCHQY